MGYDPLAIDSDQCTTYTVINELHTHTTASTRVNLAKEMGKLEIHTPTSDTMKEIEETTRKTGDNQALSQTDKEVLAIALELQRNGQSPILVTDDYAIQNTAQLLGIRYIHLTTFGIRYRFKWIMYCPACKRKYPPNTNTTVCLVCGTQLKRRVLRRVAVKRRKLI